MKNGNDINENKEEKKKDKKKKHKKHKKEKQMNDPTCNAILKEEIEKSTAQPFDDSSCNRKDDDDGNKNTQSKKKSAKEEKEQKKKLEKQLKKEAKKLEKRQNKEQSKEKTHLKKEEKKKRKERDDNMTTDDDVVDNRPKRPKKNSQKNNPDIIEETDTISATYIGLVIGKGGEMIRDLQVRSGCQIQINKNVPKGSPCPVTYQGTRQTVDFAKRLISLLCSSENGKEADLPLGEATRKHLVVSADVISLIVGKGGKVIRELQRKSQAKIQVDDPEGGAECANSSQRQVTITGTEQNVLEAEEMINFLTSNGAMDESQALGMLIEDNWKHIESEIFPCPKRYIGRVMGKKGAMVKDLRKKSKCYIQINQDVPTGHDCQITLRGTRQHIESAKTMLREFIETCASHPDAGEHIESEIFPCPKMYIGRVLGKKGVVVNDLKKKSGCDIQINQDVPTGHDCQITLRGTRQHIESAKTMLREIIKMCASHPVAGEQIESEIFPCPKMYIKMVMGKKGAKVNDLRKKSKCYIQINQDVPTGHDCQIILKGTRQHIESAKTMLRKVMKLNPKQ